MEQNSESNSKSKVKIVFPIINYTFIFLLAGFIVYFIHQLSSIYVGTFICNMPLKWTSYMVEARIPEASWDMHKVKTFFTYPSYLSLFIALIFSILFLSRYRKKGLLKIFYLWMAFHGYNMFAGHIITGLITKEGFYYPLLWMRVSDLVILIVGILSAALLIIIGSISTRAVFLIASSRSFVENAKKRSLYLLKLFVLPWAIGSILLIIAKFNPAYYYEFPQFEWLIVLPIAFILLPMFYFQQNYRRSEFVIIKSKRDNKINVSLVLFTVFLILAYRIFLIDGISI